ncbi:MAG: isoprenylcysteine carboxylmethyltransferase family protein [Oscillospiraceae bacterium]
MLWLLLGCLSFAPLYLFDLNKLCRKSKAGGLLFVLGIFGILLCTVMAYLGGRTSFFVPRPLAVFFGALSAVSLCLMLYALFFALPFGSTYKDADTQKVVSTGVYALCRHPGVIFFFFWYLFLWLATGKPLLLVCAAVFTAMDVVHVWVQDRYLFPRSLTGYAEYQKATPFLIPNRKSISAFFKTWKIF